MNRFYHIAWRETFESSYHIHNKRMCALIARGGKVLSIETNLGAKSATDTFSLGKHAEQRAIRPHEDYCGATIYVARSNGRISRPCVKCLPLIKSAGIKNMVYINQFGNLVKEWV